ncbi:MAG: uracil-DNA glycosylase, partial [Rhodanobacteraceae bacterium]
SNTNLAAIERRVTSCERCPDLREYIAAVAKEKKPAHAREAYWGKPVPAFGDPAARVMLVGLAPGAHGSNRTGRMFTGDASGNFLYPALFRAGFASQPEASASGDGMRLRNCIITSAARCAPPKNMPAPQHLRSCFPYLVEEFEALPNLQVLIGLGAIGFAAIVKLLTFQGFAFNGAAVRPAFGHGVEYEARLAERTVLALGCYHPSRQNTNTGLLTSAMLDDILDRARRRASGPTAPR